MKRALTQPTDEEEAAINAGIAADPDTRSLSDDEFAQLVPYAEAMRRRGGPAGSGRKVPVTIRLDADVVSAFKDGGDGWQTRMNEVLRGWLRERRGCGNRVNPQTCLLTRFGVVDYQ